VECEENLLCAYFTWYDDMGAFPNECFLFKNFFAYDVACTSCYSGPWSCDLSVDYCSPLTDGSGGSFYCFPDAFPGEDVPSGTDCLYECGPSVTESTCVGGRWLTVPEKMSCPCELPPGIEEGQYHCFPHLEEDAAEVEGNSVCMFTCDGNTKAELTCRDGQWAIEPADAEFTCHSGEPVPISIYTKNALDNRVLPNVNVSYMIGSTENYGEILTDGSGFASIEISSDQLPSYCQFNASFPGFYPESVESTIPEGTTQVTRTLSLTPALNSSEQLRVVMNWGRLPSDLDLHTIQIDKTTSQECETWYSCKTCCSGISLDVDNTSGGNNGAETITFDEPGNNMYRIFVFDYSGSSTYLKDSQARAY